MHLPPPSEIRAGGRELVVRRLGEGPRMIALHGGPGLDHHTLLPLGRSLASRFEVWLPDLPGHGDSPPAKGKRPGLRATLRGIEKWMDGLPDRTDVLLGHSLGGWFAQELLRRGRIRPRAAVLLSPPASGQDRDNSAVRRTIETASLFPPRKSVLEPREEALREVIGHVTVECGGQPPEAYLEMIRAAHLRPPLDYAALLRELHRALLAPVKPFDPRCPVLVLGGEMDRTTPAGQAAEVAGAILGAQNVVLPGAGHYSFADESSPTAELILRFLENLL